VTLLHGGARGARGALAWAAVGIENPVHLIFIAAVALIVLGPKRLPDLAKALGHGIREFRDSMSDGEEEGPVAPVPAAEQPPADPNSNSG
jgi:sec-independent protein translocase protein TatA